MLYVSSVMVRCNGYMFYWAAMTLKGASRRNSSPHCKHKTRACACARVRVCIDTQLSISPMLFICFYPFVCLFACRGHDESSNDDDDDGE